jgi:hypothetical protein
MACWKETLKQLKGFFEGFGFVFDSKEVPSTEKLTTEVNDLAKKDLSEFKRSSSSFCHMESTTEFGMLKVKVKKYKA